MMKVRFVWLFLALLLVPGVWGALTDDLYVYYSFDAQSAVDDYTNGYDLTNSGATFTSSAACGAYASSFDDASTQYMSRGAAPTKIIETSTDYSYSLWFYLDDIASNQGILSQLPSSSFADDTVYLARLTTTAYSWTSDPDGYTEITAADGLTDFSAGQWYHLVYSHDADGTDYVYLNGAEDASSAETAGSYSASSPTFNLGRRAGYADSYMDGRIDDVAIWTRTLSLAEAQELYNSGNCFNPLTAAPASSNATSEETVSLVQGNGVLVNSSSFVPIFSGSFSVDNDTSAFIGFQSNIIASNTDSVCRAVVDGVDYGTETYRSNTDLDWGEIFFESDVFNLSVGNYSVGLECRKENGGAFVVFNSVGIVHLLNNALNQTLNYSNASVSVTATGIGVGSEDYEYVVKNTNVTGKELQLVVEGDLVYEYGYPLPGVYKDMYVNISFGGETCGSYPRSGVNGDVGSGSFFCSLPNASSLDAVNLSFVVKGADDSITAEWVVNSSFVVREFILNNDSVKQVELAGIDVDSSSYMDVASIVLNNSEFSAANLVAQAGVSAESNDGEAQMDFRLVMDGVNGSRIFRSFSGTDRKGLVGLQGMFQNLMPGLYNVTLQARINNSDGSLVGGHFLAYLSDNEALVSEALNFTLRNSSGDLVGVFNVTTEGGVTFNASGGVAEVFSNVLLENLSVEVPGYLDFVAVGVDMSNGTWTEYVSDLDFRNFSFSGLVEYSGVNYTRVLGVGFGTIGCPADYTIQRVINGVPGSTVSFSCVNDLVYNFSYTPVSSGEFDIGFIVGYSSGNEGESVLTQNWSFVADITNPGIQLNRTTAGSGFSTDFSFTASLTCTDAISPELTYNVTYNGDGLVYGVTAANSTLQNNTDLESGDFTLLGHCSDFFGTSNASITGGEVYAKTFYLVDERNGSAFDVQNPNSVRLYFDDNRSFFDFKENDTTAINFTSFTADKLRLELTYNTTGGGGDTVITRYIDVGLVDDVARICANVHGVDHYEQLIVASQQRAVVMKNVFANCYIAADYTRFAYQDALVLKAFTISSMYYLYTFMNGEQEFLSAVDGTISSYINLDTLDFARQAYDLNILRDSLTIEKVTNVTARIRYINLKQDIASANMLIHNLDSGALLFNTSSFANPNNISVTFSWAALNITNHTVFKVTLNTVDQDGHAGSIVRYFDTNVSTGYISGVIALVLSILFVFTGFTISTARLAFSWFGIVMVVLAIGVMTLSVSEWYVLPVIAFEVVMLIYTIMMLVFTNQRSVA